MAIAANFVGDKCASRALLRYHFSNLYSGMAHARLNGVVISRKLQTLALGLAISVAPAACLSPTLPLPPPEAPESVGLAEPGVWEVSGLCTPGAVVLVKNLNTGVIAGTEDIDGNGRYSLLIEAEACQTAEVFQLLDDDTSETNFFVFETTIGGLPSGDCQ